MADDQSINPQGVQPSGPPGYLKSILGGALAGMSGTISPMQAYAMGMPQATGMTMQQLQVLAQAPEQRQNQQLRGLQIQEAQQNLNTKQESMFLNPEQAAYASNPEADEATIKKTTNSYKHLFPNGQIPKTFVALSAASRKQNQAQETKSQQDADMQTIQDYAYKNNVSMDALRPGGMGGWNPANTKMVAGIIKRHPDYDIQKLKLGYAGELAGSTKAGGTGATIGVNLTSAHQALTDTMSQAAKLADKMGQGQVALVNKAIQSGKLQFNNKDAIKLYTLLDEAGGNYARIKKGGSASTSDEDVKGSQFISNKLSSGGIKAVLDAVEPEYQGRIRNLPGYTAPQSGQPQGQDQQTQGAPDWQGGTTHTYSDGTVAQWNGNQWVKVSQ